MTFMIAVSGKGGVGKTSVLALLLKSLIDSGEDNILVVDGDPDSNMPDVLGTEVNGTIAEITDQLRKEIESTQSSPLLQKDRYLDAKIFDILHESENFDLLVLGSIEKEGCYCSINAQLKTILEKQAAPYKYLLLDLPAGLEHINRGVIREPDILLVVSDSSKMGLSTAKRIKELTEKLKTGEDQLLLIGNRVHEDMIPIFEKFAKENGYVFGGVIPEDKELQRLNLIGPSLLEISNDSSAYTKIEGLSKKFITKH